MINATDLFERTDKAFRTLREMAEGRDITPEWARLHAKGTAVGNAGAFYKETLANADYNDLAAVISTVNNAINALIETADMDLVIVEDYNGNKEANFRNALASGHADGYKLALGYFNEEVKYFRAG